MNRTWARLALAAAGYVLSFVLSFGVVQLRYLFLDPAVVEASSGMYAFGDLLWGLLLGGLLSLVPTWLLLRALGDDARLRGLLSWACLAWAATAPVSPVMLFLGAGGASRRPLDQALLLLHVLSVLRGVVIPGSLLALGLAWWFCREPAPRGRVAAALALELCGLLGVAAWLAKALLLR